MEIISSLITNQRQHILHSTFDQGLQGGIDSNQKTYPGLHENRKVIDAKIKSHRHLLQVFRTEWKK
jgi:hypothetical protein